MTAFHPTFRHPQTPRLRIEHWNDLASESPSPSTVDVPDASRFSGRLRRAQIDEFRVAEVCVTPSIVRHSRSHVVRTPVAAFALKLQLDGRSVTRQDGREASLAAGDYTLCDSLRPYEMFSDVQNRMLVLSIPDVLLRRHVASPEKVTAVGMCGDSGMSGVLSDFLLSLWQRYPMGADASVMPHVGQALLNLLASAYAQMPREVLGRPSMADMHRVRVRAYIEKHLSDPGLSISRIAAACQIKVHYLRKLFAQEEDTLTQFILRRRLEECGRKLAADAFRAQTITEIAFAQGFSNVTHFGRVFRERFGVTPSEFRRPIRALSVLAP